MLRVSPLRRRPKECEHEAPNSETFMLQASLLVVKWTSSKRRTRSAAFRGLGVWNSGFVEGSRLNLVRKLGVESDLNPRPYKP